MDSADVTSEREVRTALASTNLRDINRHRRELPRDLEGEEEMDRQLAPVVARVPYSGMQVINVQFTGTPEEASFTTTYLVVDDVSILRGSLRSRTHSWTGTHESLLNSWGTGYFNSDFWKELNEVTIDQTTPIGKMPEEDFQAMMASIRRWHARYHRYATGNVFDMYDCDRHNLRRHYGAQLLTPPVRGRGRGGRWRGVRTRGRGRREQLNQGPPTRGQPVPEEESLPTSEPLQVEVDLEDEIPVDDIVDMIYD